MHQNNIKIIFKNSKTIEKLKTTLNYRFDARDNPQLCVEYLLVKRSNSVLENGIEKEFSYVGVVAEKSYLKTKHLKMVYVESRDQALSSIPSSLCEQAACCVIFVDRLFVVDAKCKLSKNGIKVKFFINGAAICNHIKSM